MKHRTLSRRVKVHNAPDLGRIDDLISKPEGFRITVFGSHLDDMKNYTVGVLINHESDPAGVLAERHRAFREYTEDELTPERQMQIFMELEPPMYKVPDDVLAGYLDAAVHLLADSILAKLRMNRK